MKVGVPKETRRGEARVAVTPETAGKLVQRGFEVLVERGAGEASRNPDAEYEAAGATLVDAEAVWAADLVLKVAKPSVKEVKSLRPGAVLGCVLDSDENDPLVPKLAAQGVTLLALDAVPRISRAQVMDIRSSMANLAGYRAVIEAASLFPRTMGAQVTAAGSTPPAQVLIIGAGVAGLAAIAAARGLGAAVTAFDTRSAAREQVQSLGASFLEVSIEEEGEGQGGYSKVMSQAFIDAEMALFREAAPRIDVLITTALIPNRPAPRLWLADMVALMKPGSVIVDLAAVRGGNCELTEPGKTVEHHGVRIVGDPDLTQAMADHASRLLARNVLALLGEFGDSAADFRIDLTNDVIRGVTVLERGELRWPAPPPTPSPAPPPRPKEPAEVPRPVRVEEEKKAHPPPEPPSRLWMGLSFLGVLLLAVLARFAPVEFLHHLTVFVLACIIGWQVVWNVTPALHTPLMSVTNAISGIILVGGVLQVGSASLGVAFLGWIAILFASINIFGGFAVTHRMLAMFRKEAAR